MSILTPSSNIRGLCTSGRHPTLGARPSRSERAVVPQPVPLLQLEAPNQLGAENFAQALALSVGLGCVIPRSPYLLHDGFDAVAETVEGGQVLVSNRQEQVGVLRRARHGSVDRIVDDQAGLLFILPELFPGGIEPLHVLVEHAGFG